MQTVSYQELGNWIQKGRVAVLTGAGMSTESGLPDFRSNGGLWHGKDPMKIASTYALEYNFEEFTEFYRYRLEEKRKYAPHIGHRILALWEEKGYVDGIATQNVDGFHHLAGSKNVYEIHGSLGRIYCASCGKSFTEQEYMKQNRCNCGGKIRPGIVLFGEALPEDVFDQAIQLVRNCDTLLVLGTSLQVSPANLLPREAKIAGAKVVLINREPVEQFSMIDIWLEGSVKDCLEKINEELI